MAFGFAISAGGLRIRDQRGRRSLRCRSSHLRCILGVVTVPDVALSSSTCHDVDGDSCPAAADDVSRSAGERLCEWCGGPIRNSSRCDARTCSKACRQAKHRFRVTPAAATPSRPMRFAYADPPYPGLARKYYAHDPRCAEVDHRELVARLVDEYPDGWALSTSAPALPSVLAMCPAGVRVACWVKGSRSGVSYRARNAWEPLIVFRGRARRMTCHEVLDDTLIARGHQRSHPGALVGMKPAAFAEWMFRQLGALRGDSLADLFPGSGAITRAWSLYTRRSSTSDT